MCLDNSDMIPHPQNNFKQMQYIHVRPHSANFVRKAVIHSIKVARAIRIYGMKIIQSW